MSTEPPASGLSHADTPGSSSESAEQEAHGIANGGPSVDSAFPTTANRSAWPFRVALLTIAGTLIGITVGALVTTKNAGMAFRDWPTSNGHGMFAYPWLQSAGDEFLEHGHRLAGMMIGFLSIVMAVVFWKSDKRSSARWIASGVLLSVIVQGLLGGVRVLFDRRILAMIHSSFGASVLSLMAVAALVASRRWFQLPAMFRSVHGQDSSDQSLPSRIQTQPAFPWLGRLAIALPFLVLAQYLAGGMLRHLGLGLYEHVGGAVIVGTVTLVTVCIGLATGRKFLSRIAAVLAVVVFAQIALGLATFVMKFGWPASGIVAVKDSIGQVVIRTSHAVLGMLTLMTSTVFAVAVWRWNHLAHRQHPMDSSPRSVQIHEDAPPHNRPASVPVVPSRQPALPVEGRI